MVPRTAAEPEVPGRAFKRTVPREATVPWRAPTAGSMEKVTRPGTVASQVMPDTRSLHAPSTISREAS